VSLFYCLPHAPASSVKIGFAKIAEHLTTAIQHHTHEFWLDSVSLLSKSLEEQKILGSHQLSDVYLLALANQQAGQFFTLDRAFNLLRFLVQQRKI